MRSPNNRVIQRPWCSIISRTFGERWTLDKTASRCEGKEHSEPPGFTGFSWLAPGLMEFRCWIPVPESKKDMDGKTGYPPEFRRRVLKLINAGRKVGTSHATSGSACRLSMSGASSTGSTKGSSGSVQQRAR